MRNCLSALDHLPSGTWRYHTADLAHGEDPLLDDSNWPVAQPNTDYPKEGVWFRGWIQVPKLLHGPHRYCDFRTSISVQLLLQIRLIIGIGAVMGLQ